MHDAIEDSDEEADYTKMDLVSFASFPDLFFILGLYNFLRSFLKNLGICIFYLYTSLSNFQEIYL